MKAASFAGPPLGRLSEVSCHPFSEQLMEDVGRPFSVTAQLANCRSTSQRLNEVLKRHGLPELEPTPSCIFEEEDDLEEEVLNNAEDFVEVKVQIAMDSGCGKHVTPPSMIEGYSVAPSAASRQGRHFIGAGGDRIRNHGQCEINLAQDGAAKVRSNFQVADVTRMLMSVSQICDTDAEVHFNKEKGWVTDKGGKVLATFPRCGGLYVAEMTLKNPKAHEGIPNAGFTRPGGKA
jgi:hypothetical protein